MKVIFMGTPEFSSATLQKLIDDSEIEVLAVYTREPQIAGRGHKITNSSIHNLALKNNLKVITPKTLKNSEIQKEFINFNADAAVVVAYGLILPTEILNGTKFGCINIHPSLLPKWRGAAPIQRTIMNGDIESGITIIKMNEGIDSGAMIYQEKFALEEDVYYPELAEKLSIMGADILLKTLKEINRGNCDLTEQNDDEATYAKKIDKKELQINWQNSARQIQNQIRALNGAYFIHNGERIRILKSVITNEESQNQNSGRLEIVKNQLLIECAPGFIQPLILQREGKKAVLVEEFLRGFKFDGGR